MINQWCNQDYISIIIFGAVILLIAYAMYTNNPVNTLITLISIIILSTVLISTKKYVFVGYIYLLVYLGAITILFIFVLMLFNLTKLIKKKLLERLEPYIIEIWLLLTFIQHVAIFLKRDITIWYEKDIDSVTTNIDITRWTTKWKWNLTGLYQDTITTKTIDPIINIDLLTICALILLISMIGAMILVLGITEIKLKLGRWKEIKKEINKYKTDKFIWKNIKNVKKNKKYDNK